MTDGNKSWRRPPQLLTPVLENTQAARVTRRRDFRLMFTPTRRYEPQPYRNELPDRGNDLTEQLLDAIEDHHNGERAGAPHADPS